LGSSRSYFWPYQELSPVKTLLEGYRKTYVLLFIYAFWFPIRVSRARRFLGEAELTKAIGRVAKPIIAAEQKPERRLGGTV
jgi:hypothetical protein